MKSELPNSVQWSWDHKQIGNSDDVKASGVLPIKFVLYFVICNNANHTTNGCKFFIFKRGENTGVLVFDSFGLQP